MLQEYTHENKHMEYDFETENILIFGLLELKLPGRELQMFWRVNYITKVSLLATLEYQKRF